jgi:hypothetical protein
MNIYLDIDEVILGVESPMEDLIEFVTYTLDNFPNSTYWLTTHCNHGENHTDHTLRGIYPDKLVDCMVSMIKPTDWDELKTDAIDFTKPFAWFDDTLFAEEKVVLENHGALECLFKMDPKDPDMIKKALRHLKNITTQQ